MMHIETTLSELPPIGIETEKKLMSYVCSIADTLELFTSEAVHIESKMDTNRQNYYIAGQMSSRHFVTGYDFKILNSFNDTSFTIHFPIREGAIRTFIQQLFIYVEMALLQRVRHPRYQHETEETFGLAFNEQELDKIASHLFHPFENYLRYSRDYRQMLLMPDGRFKSLLAPQSSLS